MLRITGGTLRGRKIQSLEGLSTRPTSDRVREALFNILAHKEWFEDGHDILTGAIVLDAFAGTGALGFEALSWGAAKVFFFDKAKEACSILRENTASLGLSDQTRIERADATLPPPAPEACSLIFLDPPYRKTLIEPTLKALEQKGWIQKNTLVVIETEKGEALSLPDGYEERDQRSYGHSSIRFWMRRD